VLLPQVARVGWASEQSFQIQHQRPPGFRWGATCPVVWFLPS
jgi:hypothetical protein